MATIRSFMSFDQRELNFAEIFGGRTNADIATNRDFEVYGFRAEDVLAIDLNADDGGYRKVLFFGEGLTANSNDKLTGGTVSMLAEAYSALSVFYDSWLIAGLNINATDFTRAANTKNTADDTELLKKALNGHDRFDLGGFGDFVNGYGGNDNITGRYGEDTLIGGNGNDTLDGGAGDDRLSLDSGNDLIRGSLGTDILTASGKVGITIDLNVTGAQYTGRGLDTIRSIEDVIGAVGNDRISGTKGANWIEGGRGADHLDGRAGSDVLVGGWGSDILTGGTGRDQFVFTSAASMGGRLANSDVITDFQQGRDIINLDAVDGLLDRAVTVFNADGFSGAGVPEVSFRKLDLAGTDNDRTVVQLDKDGDGDVDGYIRINGLFDLAADDFLL